MSSSVYITNKILPPTSQRTHYMTILKIEHSKRYLQKIVFHSENKDKTQNIFKLHRCGRQPKTYVKSEAAITVFELLMMGGVSPETC